MSGYIETLSKPKKSYPKAGFKSGLRSFTGEGRTAYIICVTITNK